MKTRISKVLHRSLVFVCAVVTIVAPATSVYALNDANRDKYSINHIRWYDPDEVQCRRSKIPDGSEITYVGDSIGESLLTQLNNNFKGIDVEDKTYDGTLYRQVRYSKFISTDRTADNNYSGLHTVEKLVENGDMRSYLIFQLGTNGGISSSQIDELMTLVGDKTNVMMLTVYNSHSDKKSTYDRYNTNLINGAKKYENLYYADWATVADSDPAAYIDDSDNLGVHLTSAGKDQYIKVLKEGLTNNFGSKSGSSKSAKDKTVSILSGTNKNYAGVQVWTDDELEKIEQNRPVYEAASAKYGVPWEAIVTMHSLEHGLKLDNPANGQGMYQLYSYTDGGTNSNAFLPAGPVSHEEFVRQTDIATSIMAGMIKSKGLDVASDEGIKSLLFQYNGTADVYIQKALKMGFSQEEANWGEGSAYVMNRYDEKRDPTSPNMSPFWPGRFVADGVYDQDSTSPGFGGFVKYVALGGGNGNSCKVSGDLEGTVLRFAWPEYHAAQYLDRMPDYADAVTQRSGEGKWVGGSVRGVAGIDCGGFVTTLLNESGFAPDYNYGGDTSKGASAITYGQLPYLASHSDEWVLVNADWNTPIPDESVLSPGDVAFSNCDSQTSCGHTYVYVGEITGFDSHIASASYSTTGEGGRSPMAGKEAIIQSTDGIIRWYHKVK